jgi:putative serine protease PepD
MTRLKLPLIVLAVSAVVAAVVGFSNGHASSQTTAVSSGTASSLQDTFINVFHKVSPSVVQISDSEGLGSGIVLDTKGDIVTNDHVVTGSTTFTVTTSTYKRLTGKLVGEFPQDDLAVIKVSGANLHPATFADSGKLQVGQIALAIGNPLGLSSSVTEGIVSALDRQESEGNGNTLVNAIQTSAPINPGNSGGALVDIQGRVIGIPTLAASDPQLGSTAAGIGFAIPSNTVTDIADQIIKYGHVVNSHRAYIGVEISDTGNGGAYVAAVTAGGPAAKAGIVVGDVITAVNGTQTPTFDELGTVLATFKPGQSVKVTLLHQNGGTSTVNVTLGELPATTSG